MTDKKWILLVEDNPDDVELFKHALRKSNILNELVVVGDGAEALDFLYGTGTHQGRDTSAMPAVMLLDLKLPKVGGLEVLRHLRADERTRYILVVILTASTNERDIMNCYRLGCNSYIRKPLDLAQFSETVKDLGLYWLLLNESPVI